jgi:hypothetical protein
VDIGALVGSSLAYVGFTGGTGGLTTVADVQTWTYQANTLKKNEELQSQVAAGAASSLMAPDLLMLTFPVATDLPQPLPAMFTSPLADDRDPEGELAAAFVTAPPPLEIEWLSAAASEGNDSDDASDALFAQLEDQEEFLDLLGDELGEVLE